MPMMPEIGIPQVTGRAEITGTEGDQSMSLHDKLAAFKAEFSGKRPPEIVATMQRATAALIASGAAERALKVGDRAPDFALPDQDARMVRLADLLASGPVVLTFYRGVWCPYCNMDLQALEETRPQIAAAGASLLAISPQTAANSRKALREKGLSFPILSDAGNAVAAEFGIRFRLPDELITLYKGFGNDLAVVNGDASWTLPMPARFVIGQDGIIRYAEVNPDYTIRPEPEDVLPALSGAVARAAE
jgi:peroxiredoxin